MFNLANISLPKIKHVLCIAVILLIIINCYSVSMGAGIQIQSLGTTLLSAITIRLIAKMYPQPKLYYRRLISLTFIYFAALIFLYLGGLSSTYNNIAKSIFLFLSIANIIIFTFAILRKNILTNIFNYLLSFLYTIPAIIIIGYYCVYHKNIAFSAIVAIGQTNSTEIINYFKDFHSPYMILLSILAFILFLFILRKLDYTKSITPPYKIKLFVYILLVLISILSINNIITSPYIKYNEYRKEFVTLQQQKNSRQDYINKNIIFNKDQQSGIYVLVIGETMNRKYASVYGYNKADTTPWTKAQINTPNFFLFKNSFASYPQTVQAVTYAISLKNQYNNIPLAEAPSIIEMAKAAGYQTIWLSNQGKSDIYAAGITAMAQEADINQWINYEPVEQSKVYYDKELLQRLKDIKLHSKALIILHLKGSHYPYIDRTPESFNKFHNIDNQYVTEYLNTVLYNDYVLSEIINYFKGNKNFKALVYTSDHGESVADHQMHNATNYNPEMIYVPLYVYLSNNYLKENPGIASQLKKAKNYPFTNDLTANLLMSIMDLKIPKYYEPNNDLLNPNYDTNYKRFKTMYGAKDLPE